MPARPAGSWPDVLVALTGLLVLWPVMLLIALAVKLDSRGPSIYSEERLGRSGVPFRIFKFRTLDHCTKQSRPIAPSDDARITRLGAWLRPLHLDELPQLFNIVRGEMRLVGPRPAKKEIWSGVDRGLRQRALGFTPGLTSPASVRFDCEDDVLAEMRNPHEAYRDILFPARVAMDVRHFESRRRWSDLKILVFTASTVLGTRNRARCRRRILRLLQDNR